MMRPLLLSLLSLLFFLASIIGCQEQNVFINPPPEGQTVDYSSISNPVWIWGTKQVVKWSTTYPLFTLFLWQQPVLNGKDYFYPLVGEWFLFLPFVTLPYKSEGCSILYRKKGTMAEKQSLPDSQPLQRLPTYLDRRHRP